LAQFFETWCTSETMYAEVHLTCGTSNKTLNKYLENISVSNMGRCLHYFIQILQRDSKHKTHDNRKLD